MTILKGKMDFFVEVPVISPNPSLPSFYASHEREPFGLLLTPAKQEGNDIVAQLSRESNESKWPPWLRFVEFPKTPGSSSVWSSDDGIHKFTGNLEEFFDKSNWPKDSNLVVILFVLANIRGETLDKELVLPMSSPNYEPDGRMRYKDLVEAVQKLGPIQDNSVLAWNP